MPPGVRYQNPFMTEICGSSKRQKDVFLLIKHCRHPSSIPTVLCDRFPTVFAMEKDGAHYSRLVATDEEPEPFVKVNVHDIVAPTDRESSTPHRQVYIYVNVFSLSGIDTVAQTFDCHFFLRAMWKEPVESPADEEWHPNLVFMNSASPVEMSDIELSACPWRKGPLGEKVMQWRADCRGTFREGFELEHFPFDVQALTITVSCNRPSSEVTLLEDRYTGAKSILRNQFTVMTDFDLSGPLMQGGVDEERKRYPLLHIYFIGQRRAAYYMWNIGLPNFLLSVLVFTSFAISPEDLEDRLSVTLTLVLTSVAFKYMVAQELPKISYLTLLDKYILLSFTFLALVGGQNTLAAVVKVDYGTFPIVDVSRYVIETIFLLIHVLLGALSLHYMFLESKKLARLQEGCLGK